MRIEETVRGGVQSSLVIRQSRVKPAFSARVSQRRNLLGRRKECARGGGRGNGVPRFLAMFTFEEGTVRASRNWLSGEMTLARPGR